MRINMLILFLISIVGWLFAMMVGLGGMILFLAGHRIIGFFVFSISMILISYVTYMWGEYHD